MAPLQLRYQAWSAAGALLFVATSLVFVACGGGGEPAEPTAAESPSVSAVAESTPTAAPSPEAAARPTAAPTPAATAAPAVIGRSAQKAGSAPTEPEWVDVGANAPELAGITGWINSEPFTLASLQGKVVLLDFWTYTCVNCIRTLPFLKDWHEKYSDSGLVIVGVHSPEFEFERKLENVRKATERFGIQYAVALDSDIETWNAYKVPVWPTKFIIDKNGVVQHLQFGEGSYDRTETKIRELLTEIDAPVSQIGTTLEPGPEQDQRSRARDGTGETRELYAGFVSNQQTRTPYINQYEFSAFPPGAPAQYEDPGDHQNHFLYFHGLWFSGLESMNHARDTENLEDYVALKAYGTSVNVVVAFDEGETYQVVVTMDEEPIAQDHRGADIQEDEEGTTFFLVDDARMYGVIESSEYAGRELKLTSNSARFRLFAFTFGSYPEGP